MVTTASGNTTFGTSPVLSYSSSGSRIGSGVRATTF